MTQSNNTYDLNYLPIRICTDRVGIIILATQCINEDFIIIDQPFF